MGNGCFRSEMKQNFALRTNKRGALIRLKLFVSWNPLNLDETTAEAFIQVSTDLIRSNVCMGLTVTLVATSIKTSNSSEYNLPFVEIGTGTSRDSELVTINNWYLVKLEGLAKFNNVKGSGKELLCFGENRIQECDYNEIRLSTWSRTLLTVWVGLRGRVLRGICWFGSEEYSVAVMSLSLLSSMQAVQIEQQNLFCPEILLHQACGPSHFYPHGINHHHFRRLRWVLSLRFFFD